MTMFRRTAALAVSITLLTGGAIALAPAASAAGSSACTYNLTDFTGTADGDGINFRAGPGTGYTAKGRLYDGDRLRVSCGKGRWYYSKLAKRSKGGLAKGTTGWIRSDMLYQLAG
ncbi:SH3 domain-containing protein [Streptomyces phaeochromogenes]|uniref:SH3 domain-containing protein n=1 Tax=Streptomyces phaeochromogenes TaxID=1923 RepID=UPI0033EDCE07